MAQCQRGASWERRFQFRRRSFPSWARGCTSSRTCSAGAISSLSSRRARSADRPFLVPTAAPLRDPRPRRTVRRPARLRRRSPLAASASRSPEREWRNDAAAAAVHMCCRGDPRTLCAFAFAFGFHSRLGVPGVCCVLRTLLLAAFFGSGEILGVLAVSHLFLPG
jgi:hypothetical protein